MSAEVLGSGRAAHLMDVHEVRAQPQVHVHNLTEVAEFQQRGYARTELCCHGCGVSLMVIFNHCQNAIGIRDVFVAAHSACKYISSDPCPNYRSTFNTIDLRRPPLQPKRRSRTRHVKIPRAS